MYAQAVLICAIMIDVQMYTLVLMRTIYYCFNTAHQGEFDLHFLSDLLDQYGAGPSTHFADLGSGAGRQAAHILKNSSTETLLRNSYRVYSKTAS
jgi:Histone methylation protein DOT1